MQCMNFRDEIHPLSPSVIFFNSKLKKITMPIIYYTNGGQVNDIF